MQQIRVNLTDQQLQAALKTPQPETIDLQAYGNFHDRLVLKWPERITEPKCFIATRMSPTGQIYFFYQLRCLFKRERSSEPKSLSAIGFHPDKNKARARAAMNFIDLLKTIGFSAELVSD